MTTPCIRTLLCASTAMVASLILAAPHAALAAAAPAAAPAAAEDDQSTSANQAVSTAEQKPATVAE